MRTNVLNRWDYIIRKNAERITDSTERNLFIEKENEYLETKINFIHKKYEQWKDDCDTLNDILKRIKTL